MPTKVYTIYDLFILDKGAAMFKSDQKIKFV
jgi:hypothetical protein